MEDLSKDVLKDIQYLLCMFEGYIEDNGGNAWQDNDFVRLATKYEFDKNDLHRGFEHLFC